MNEISIGGFSPEAGASAGRMSFSTEGMPAGDALEAWRARFGQLNEVIPAEDVPFSASVSFWRLGNVVFSSNRASAVRLVRAAERARRDGFDQWVLRVSHRGVVRSRSGERVYASRPGELVLERLSDPYDDEWSTDCWIAAILPSNIDPELDARLSALPRGPVPGGRAALLADYLLALDRRLPGMSKADLDAVAGATPRMIALLSPPEEEPDRFRPSLTQRLRVEKIIRANLGSARLDSCRLAVMAGMSRSTLYRLFEDRGGVARHIREIRLETAHAALRDPARRGETIAGIAAQCGFHCQAAFNRAFRRRYGQTPGDVRAEARAPSGPVSGRRQTGGDFLDMLLTCAAPREADCRAGAVAFS